MIPDKIPTPSLYFHITSVNRRHSPPTQPPRRDDSYIDYQEA